MKACGWCRAELVDGARSTYCSTRCRVAAFRERRRGAVTPAGERNEDPVTRAIASVTASRSTVAALYVRADSHYKSIPGVDQVRFYGGVLEHPAASHLWVARDLPKPGDLPDQWGGWSMLVRQGWFGHQAPKPTWIYIVGRAPGHVPEMPAPAPDPGGRIENMARRERELTPLPFALWLVDLARDCDPAAFRRRRTGSLRLPGARNGARP